MPPEDWGSIITKLGFPDERAMWEDLYGKKKFTIKQLAAALGFGSATIRRRIFDLGIDLRSRGGAHPRADSKLLLLRMDPRIAFYGSITEAARIAALDKTTVYHYRRWISASVIDKSDSRTAKMVEVE